MPFSSSGSASRTTSKQSFPFSSFFKPLSYTESILGFNGDNAKILVFDISKDDYESNNLHYSDESIGALAYGTNKEDMGDYYRIPADNRNLNYQKYVDQGNADLDKIEDYNSHNTQRLDLEGMKELLLKLDLFEDCK